MKNFLTVLTFRQWQYELREALRAVDRSILVSSQPILERLYSREYSVDDAFSEIVAQGS